MNAHLKFITSMVIFGSIGYFSVKTELPSIELVFFRCLCASILLGFVWLLGNKRRGNNRETVHRKEFLFALLCGFFLIVNWVFFFRSIELMPITVAVSIYHLAPVLVLLLGALFFKERITFTAGLAIVICFIGTLLVGGILQHATLDDFLSTGVLWAFGAALFYALTTLTGKAIRTLDPILTTVIQTTLGIILLFPLVDWANFSQLSVENWSYILLTGFVHTGFVFYLFFSSVRSLKAETIAILVFLDPAVAILMDVVLIGYYPDIYQTIGIILTFLGMGYAFKK